MKRQSIWMAAALGAALVASGCGSDDGGADTSSDVQSDAGSDTAGTDTGTDTGGEDGATDTGTDTGTDAGHDVGDNDATDAGGDASAGKFEAIKESKADEVLEFPDLNSVVHLARDKDGIPHILADNAHDAFYVQGYIHASDRFAQMVLIRGNVGGTLAKLAGSLDADSVGDDIFARVMGFHRVAQQTWDAMEEGPAKDVIQAYVDGINYYLQRLKDKEVSIPSAFALLVNPKVVDPWTPADVLTLAKYQIYQLGFDALGEINRSKDRIQLEQWLADNAGDDGVVARAGIMSDLKRFAPADDTFQVEGFTANPWGGPLPAAPPISGAISKWKQPSLAQLSVVADSLARPNSAFAMFQGPPEGASNSWVVSGALTETGNAMLANDPHLSTNSPPLFHGTHLVVEPKDDSEPAMDLYGLQFPGLPGILLGHNKHVAWGFTTSGHDYTDAYVEQLVWKEGEEWPRVLHNGEEVELEIVEEVVEIGIAGTVTSSKTVKVPIVPHRGPLAPKIVDNDLVPPAPGDETAISLAWTGFGPTFELEAIYEWWTAQTVSEAMNGMREWQTASQHVVFVDLEGNIGYGVDGVIPSRPEAARDWDPTTNPDGNAPWWTLSGTGEHDWLPEPLSRDETPNAYNPAKGYVVTANNDAVGVTADNNPLNDYNYVGYDYDLGFRAGRITRRLMEAADNGDKVTLAEMGEIQSDHYSNLGDRLVPFFIEAGEALAATYDDDAAHPDLADVVAAHPDDQANVQMAVQMLKDWSLMAEDGVWGEPTAAQIADANATALFNFWMVATIRAAFNDELMHVSGVGSTDRAKGLLHILENPTTCATALAETGQSVLWDDLSTTEVFETRNYVMAQAFFTAWTELVSAWGSDPASWIWGDTHTKQFTSLIPIGGGNAYTWPQEDEGWGEGFPRHGDNYNVDACNGGVTDYGFSCGGVALQRLIVEAKPEGFASFNAFPGGQVWDKDSPYYRNQLPTWLDNERRESWLTEEQILPNIDAHWIIQPAE